VLSLALVPFMKPISQKIGKRNGLIVAGFISLALALIQPLILSPKFPWLLVIPQMVILPLIMLSNTLATAIVPDICDLDELENGQRREGLFTAVMGFVQKLEISLTILIVGYLISFSGFDSTLKQQPVAVLHRLLWLAVVPYIVFGAATVLMALRFPMTEESMAEVRRQLDARRDIETFNDTQVSLDKEVAVSNSVPARAR
jgi:GPH family glycoside/pentoside/hexuronide:cation symporter